jgi:hypothetical protein
VARFVRTGLTTASRTRIPVRNSHSIYGGLWQNFKYILAVPCLFEGELVLMPLLVCLERPALSFNVIEGCSGTALIPTLTAPRGEMESPTGVFVRCQSEMAALVKRCPTRLSPNMDGALGQP